MAVVHLQGGPCAGIVYEYRDPPAWIEVFHMPRTIRDIASGITSRHMYWRYIRPDGSLGYMHNDLTTGAVRAGRGNYARD